MFSVEQTVPPGTHEVTSVGGSAPADPGNTAGHKPGQRIRATRVPPGNFPVLHQTSRGVSHTARDPHPHVLMVPAAVENAKPLRHYHRQTTS